MLEDHWKFASEKTDSNLPVFDDFLLLFSQLSKQDTINSSNMF